MHLPHARASLLVPFLVACAACAPSSGLGGSGGAPGSGASGAGAGTSSAAGGAGGATTASGGGSACAADSADCDGKAENGCETVTSVDIANCGTCGKACPTGPNATATCEAGVCELTCNAGYDDCDGDPADGCEAFTQNDAANCGTCGHACPDGPGVAALCVAGACTLDCPPGSGDCDGNAANGCETNTNASGAHCGSCGLDCMGSPCVQGACACASETQQAQKLQLDLFIMLDQSGSMDDPVQGGGTKWDATKTALNAFFTDPQSAGLGVGIQFFALPPVIPPPVLCSTNADCGFFAPCFLGLCVGGGGSNGNDSCNPADYAVPAVEIAPLDAAHAAALSSSVAAHAPATDTPTAPALQGAIDHAKAWASAHPGHGAVVVLATDGDPTECNPMDIPSIANLAAAGVAGQPSVKTFVIGVGPSLSNLNAIAAGGGTGSAFLVDTAANVVQQFQAALEAIQQTALGCEYAIPQPQMGSIDFGKVNVQFTPGGGNPVLLPNVANAAACDPQTGGWYYDDSASPTKILLCPTSCATAESDPNGKIEILLGCDTIHD